jgi:hypothetical protein
LWHHRCCMDPPMERPVKRNDLSRSVVAFDHQTRTTGAKPSMRKTMIVALARKLLIALWRYVTTGVMPAGVVLRAAT